MDAVCRMLPAPAGDCIARMVHAMQFSPVLRDLRTKVVRIVGDGSTFIICDGHNYYSSLVAVSPGGALDM